MKNKSLKYPFTRVGDRYYDHNNDGQLDFWETIERDAQIIFDEETRKKSEKQSTYTSNNKYISNAYTPNFKYNTENTPQVHQNTENQSFLMLLLAIIVLVGGLILVFFVKGGLLLRILILSISISLGIFLLKSGSFM